MLDQRKQQRLPAFLHGVISYRRKFWTSDCIIKNTSDGGAKLYIRDLPTLPEQFELSVPRRNAEYRVRLKWRRDGELGVAIEQSHALVDPADQAKRDRRAKRLARENAALRHRLALAPYTD